MGWLLFQGGTSDHRLRAVSLRCVYCHICGFQGPPAAGELWAGEARLVPVRDDSGSFPESGSSPVFLLRPQAGAAAAMRARREGSLLRAPAGAAASFCREIMAAAPCCAPSSRPFFAAHARHRQG